MIVDNPSAGWHARCQLDTLGQWQLSDVEGGGGKPSIMTYDRLSSRSLGLARSDRDRWLEPAALELRPTLM